MFSTKGRLKVTLFVVGFLVVGLKICAVFQTQEVEAHPHTLIQSTVTSTITVVELTTIEPYSYRCDRIFPDLKNLAIQVCYGTVTGKKYTDQLVDYEVTTYYFDDGHEVYWEPGGERKLTDTYRDGTVSYEHYGCDGSLCNRQIA